jgi:hypothetical protein
MKSIKLLSLTLILALGIFACKRIDSPEAVAEKFMNHLIAGEFSKAKEYGTESTKQMMQMFEALESLGGETFSESMEAPDRVKNMQCDVQGDTAICRFEENGEMSELNMVKIDGVWLVDMKKENPFGDMEFNEDVQWEVEEEQ